MSQDHVDEDLSIWERLQVNTSAEMWATEFLNLFYVGPKDGQYPENESARTWQWGLMVSWFANAIEVAKGHERKRVADQVRSVAEDIYPDMSKYGVES